MNDRVYGQHFVGFFDILGFSEVIGQAVGEEEARDAIERFDAALRGLGDRFSEQWSWETGAFNVKMFSDCICVSVPADPANIDAFFHEIAYLQSWMCLEAGVALRGAVTVGRHFVSEYMIFSEALVEAYKLEQDKRTPPCIIVSDNLHRYVMESPGDSDMTRVNAAHFQHGYVMKDDHSGRLFLDYLNFMPASADDTERLRAHRAWIIENLDLHRGSPSVVVKYEWLRDYHNSWCQIFESHRANLSDLLIDIPNRRFSFRTDTGPVPSADQGR